MEEDLHADAGAGGQDGGDKGQEGLGVAVLRQVMLPDLQGTVDAKKDRHYYLEEDVFPLWRFEEDFHVLPQNAQ